jgi:hypothetical protein
MPFSGSRILAVLLCAAFVAGAVVSAHAQGSNPDQRPAEQKSQTGGEAAKPEAEKKRDIVAEAARKLTGPAANAECTWTGVRAVRLLSQDDLDTAFRHLDLYDRFGCPGNHIQATFRCVTRQPDLSPKATESLTTRVYDCWLDPAGSPPASAAAPAAATSPAPGGTTAR